ncbi:uncharacterized protein BJ212DRAFT_1250008, partial [Suillus subaureus]
KDYDIVIIQEPFVDILGNTKASPDWNVVYPTQKYSHQDRTCAVILINKCINMSNWRQLPFPSYDVTVVQLNGAFGKITIFNIYDD